MKNFQMAAAMMALTAIVSPSAYADAMYYMPATSIGYGAPTAPVASYYVPPAPVVSYYAPAPVVSYYTPAPVVSYAPAPVVSYYSPAPVVYSAPVSYYTPAVVSRGLFGRTIVRTPYYKVKY